VKQNFIVYITFVLLLSCSNFSIFAGTIRGKITDQSTNESLIGATVTLKNTSIGAKAGLDGSYRIRSVPKGEYTVIVRYIGYETKERKISFKNDLDTLRINFQLSTSKLQRDQVVVEGRKNFSTEESARTSVQQSPTVLNIVSAKTIEVSPDIQVAQVIQRVSGVSIERNQNGDGQYAIVRGMDKRYNYTLINGVKIPSPDNSNRYIPLDIFPAELLDRLEVTKSLTPDMEGDAIGGVVNLVMKNAPEYFIAKANASVGANLQYFGTDSRKYLDFNSSVQNHQSPNEVNPPATDGSRYQSTLADFPLEASIFTPVTPPINFLGGFTIGNRFGAEKEFGVIVATSYQSQYLGTDSKLFTTDVNRENNSTAFNSVLDREFSVRQIRTGVHSKMDYEFSPLHKISLYNAYVHLEDKQTRFITDTNLARNRLGVGEGTVAVEYRSRQQLQKIYNGTLQGNHILSNDLQFNWSAVYSLATNNDPDMATLQLTTESKLDSNGVNKQLPIFYDQDYLRRWTSNSDRDIASYANFLYTNSNDAISIDYKFGGMFRLKSRENIFDRYLIRPNPSNQEYTGDITKTTFRIFNPGGSNRNSLNYSIDENVYAGYAQAKVLIDNFQLLGGVRFEHTALSWITQGDPSIDGSAGEKSYSDVLPSLHLKYMATKQINWRANYFRSISRPGFFEVIPYNIFEEDYAQQGNPNLNRVKADNVDLRFEYFPEALDQILIGVFYKRIQDPIERALQVQGTSIAMTTRNFGIATNYGFEADFTKYMNKFGIRANYTYTNSTITTDKSVRFRVTESDVVAYNIDTTVIKVGSLTERIDSQTRPLQGQSAHIANVSLLYKDIEEGWDVQLSGILTGERLAIISPFKENDEWERTTIQVDASLEKQFSEIGLTFFFKVRNLLDTPLEQFIKQTSTNLTGDPPLQTDPNRILVRRDLYNRTIQLGLRYTL